MTTLLPIALGLLLQSTALLLLGLAAMHFARRRGPAVQSLVGRAALAGIALALLLAAPLAGHVRPVWKVTLGEPAPRQVAAPPAAGGGGGRTVTAAYPLDEPHSHQAALPDAPSKALADPAPTGPKQINPATTFSALPPPPPAPGGAATCRGAGSPWAACRGAGSLWTLGTAFLLLWLAFCHCHLTRLRRLASPVTSGPAHETLAALTTRPPLLLTHSSIRSPFLAGIQRPAIFLPTTYEADFDLAALRAILAHELAHLARRDNAWTLAARLLTALLWPQPLLWVLCRRLEQTGEEACDLAVLAQDCPPRAYADCLLTLAERHPLGRRERALGVGVAPFRSSLGRRIGRILDKGTHAMSAVTLRLRLIVTALAIAAALGGVFLVSSASTQPSQPVHDDPAARIVQNYLLALKAGHYDDAYALLSPETQQALPLAQFRGADNMIVQRLQWQDAHAPDLKALGGLFYDTHGRMGYHYKVTGTIMRKTNAPNLELVPVPAEGPGLPGGGTSLQIAVTTKAGGVLRLDSRLTFFLAPPATFNHASARLTDLHCYLNMKQVALAIWQYAYNHKDRFPDADRWMDEIKPYLKDEDYYHDPAAPASERYSYAYNRNLSGAADDRVSDMSETVMLFESSLNVRNASDTGQSLIKPARHGGQLDLVCVNIGGPGRNSRPSFALHIAPPNFFAKASPAQLVRLQKRAQAQLVSEQIALAGLNQQFETELRRAVPQADAPRLAQARMLERKIGLQVMGLQGIEKLRRLPIRNSPEGQASSRHMRIWTEAQLRPLLAQEAQLLPNVPNLQRAKLHAVAASLTNLQFNVEFSQEEIKQFSREKQRRQ